MTVIPRVPERRLIGSLLAFRDDRLGLLRRAFETDARIAQFTLGPIPVVLVNDADLAHEVLVERPADFVKFQVSGMPASRRLLGRGVLQTDGDEHRARRRRIMPAFLPARIATYASVMAEEAERQQAGWKNGNDVAIDRAMEELTLAIFGRTLFGVDLRGESRALAEAIGTSIATVVAEAVRFMHLPLWWPNAEHRRFRCALRRLEGTIDALVRARRAEMNGAENDLLSTLARQSKDDAMSDVEVREELLNLVVAGFEATATSLAWALDLLARDPARSEAVHEETCAVLGGRSPTVDDLPKLPRAAQAFQESMRLYPAAHMILRQTARAVDLGGYALGAGAAVFVNGYAIHRRADVWLDAESFVPERFGADAGASAVQRRSYFPFGEGPHTCIGNHFAALEGQVVVATILQRVTLAPLDSRPPATTAGFAVKARAPLMARVKRR
jgi:cytochrome P450